MKIPQPIPAARRFTINDFNELFFDNDACLEWLMEQRYPGSVATCSYCKVERKHHRISSKKAWACDYCGTYISPMAGTIFAKSSTSLRLWFYAMYLMSATRCGISAKQIQRECGVTYKTAWRMFKQIRTLMAEDFVTSGPVEMAAPLWSSALNTRPERQHHPLTAQAEACSMRQRMKLIHKPVIFYRSAITGQRVTAPYAAAHPRTTEREIVYKPSPKKG